MYVCVFPVALTGSPINMFKIVSGITIIHYFLLNL